MVSNSVILAIALTITPHKIDIALRALANKYYATREAGSAMMEKYVLALPTGYNYLRKGLWSRDAEVASRCYTVAKKLYTHQIKSALRWDQENNSFYREAVPCEACAECGWTGLMFPDSSLKYVAGFVSIYFPL